MHIKLTADIRLLEYLEHFGIGSYQEISDLLKELFPKEGSPANSLYRKIYKNSVINFLDDLIEHNFIKVSEKEVSFESFFVIAAIQKKGVQHLRKDKAEKEEGITMYGNNNKVINNFPSTNNSKVEETKLMSNITNDGTITLRDKKTSWLKKQEFYIPILIAFISIPWWPNLISFISAGTKHPPRKNAIVSPKSTLPGINNLRILEPSEAGVSINELPDNTYFYSRAIDVSNEIRHPSKNYLNGKISYTPYHDFEIQKTGQKCYIIGFVSDEAYSKVNTLGSTGYPLTVLYPHGLYMAKNSIAIPFDQVTLISQSLSKYDTTISLLTILCKEAIANSKSHIK